MKAQKPKVLFIGGSDNTCQAGIGADILTAQQFSCQPYFVITNVLAQNFHKTCTCLPIPKQLVLEQLKLLQEENTFDAIKIGMLGKIQIAEIIEIFLKKNPNSKKIIDPVLESSAGTSLIKKNTLKYCQKALYPLCDLLTPNYLEARILANFKSKNPEILAQKLSQKFKCKILLKGGHIPDKQAKDYLFDKKIITFTNHRAKKKANSRHGLQTCFSRCLRIGKRPNNATSNKRGKKLFN